MSNLQIVTNNNFDEFLSLLKERGETPEDYYKWKFVEQIDTIRPIGFLAKENNGVFGGVGFMNYQLYLPGEEPIQANWFADWYVTDLARGKGIGKKLIKACADSSTIGFGMPGPIYAQKVAENSGYQYVSGFVELQIPIRPTAVGLKRYGGSVLKKGLRSIKLNFDYFICIGLKRRNKIVLEWGKPSVENWCSAFSRILSHQTYFLREEARLSHFLKMPISKDREWWYYETENCFVTGYIEKDIWGLRRAKIIDLICDELDYSMIFMCVLTALRKNKVDLALIISTEKHFKTMKVKKAWRIELPLYQTEKNQIKLDYLSNLDKESAWADLKF